VGESWQSGTRLATVEPATLFEPGELRDYLGFAARSVRRRWKLFAVVLMLFGGATYALSQILPRRWHVESTLFALPADGVPGAVRAASGEPSGLAPGAADVIHTRENLEAVIRGHDLRRRFEQSRAPVLRMVDRASELLRREPADEASRERALLDYLRKKLTVQVNGAQVTIAFDWPEPQTAIAVVRDSVEKLLIARRAAEVLPLERKSNALDAALGVARKGVEGEVARVNELVKSRRSGARPATVRALQAEGRFRDMPDPGLARMRLELIGRRKAIAETEELRRKRLTELQSTLAEQRATLGPANTALLDTEEKIQATERQGEQLESMKAEEQALLSQYVRAGGKEIELSMESAPAWPAELKDDDELLAYGKARVAMELSSLERLQSEATEARAALAAGRAIFPSRYAVLTPAEMPDQPAFPTATLLLPAGVLGGLLLALFAAVAADLRGGTIRESWQARRLDLPVLAVVPDA
jgi:hypothetical protein